MSARAGKGDPHISKDESRILFVAIADNGVESFEKKSDQPMDPPTFGAAILLQGKDGRKVSPNMWTAETVLEACEWLGVQSDGYRAWYSKEFKKKAQYRFLHAAENSELEQTYLKIVSFIFSYTSKATKWSAKKIRTPLAKTSEKYKRKRESFCKVIMKALEEKSFDGYFTEGSAEIFTAWEKSAAKLGEGSNALVKKVNGQAQKKLLLTVPKKKVTQLSKIIKARVISNLNELMINLQLKLFSKDPIISQYVLLFDKVWFEVQKDEARGNKATLISAIASMECCSHGTLADVADKIDLLLKNVQDPAARSKILRWFQSSYLVLAEGAIRGGAQLEVVKLPSEIGTTGIAHRDLKSNNFLLSELNSKLADHGYGAVLKPGALNSTVGTFVPAVANSVSLDLAQLQVDVISIFEWYESSDPQASLPLLVRARQILEELRNDRPLTLSMFLKDPLWDSQELFPATAFQPHATRNYSFHYKQALQQYEIFKTEGADALLKTLRASTSSSSSTTAKGLGSQNFSANFAKGSSSSSNFISASPSLSQPADIEASISLARTLRAAKEKATQIFDVDALDEDGEVASVSTVTRSFPLAHTQAPSSSSTAPSGPQPTGSQVYQKPKNKEKLPSNVQNPAPPALPAEQSSSLSSSVIPLRARPQRVAAKRALAQLRLDSDLANIEDEDDRKGKQKDAGDKKYQSAKPLAKRGRK